MAVEALDRVIKSARRFFARQRGKRIVDPSRPILFVEGLDDQLLINGGTTKTLNQVTVPMELTSFGIPYRRGRVGISTL